MSSITFSADSNEDSSLHVLYSRKLADNASEILYYESGLERLRSFSQPPRKDIEHFMKMIDRLHEEREQLSVKYMKVVQPNK